MRVDFILAAGLGVMLMSGICCTAIAAETSNAASQDVTGTVNDALGRPIAAATVTLQDARGKTKGQTMSDSAGHFTISSVPPGTYAVIVNKNDFKPAT